MTWLEYSFLIKVVLDKCGTRCGPRLLRARLIGEAGASRYSLHGDNETGVKAAKMEASLRLHDDAVR